MQSFLLSPFLLSTGVVALAEMGDKTQLLALVLAAHFRKPLAITAGILVATLANHGLAGWAGAVAGDMLDGFWFRFAVAASFLGLGLWSLMPDQLERVKLRHFGAFATALIAFFLVEIGDKTQIATVVLAAEHQALPAVVAGTTLGMMLANLPVILLGQAFADRLPLEALRFGAAAAFIGIGAWLFFRLLVP